MIKHEVPFVFPKTGRAQARITRASRARVDAAGAMPMLIYAAGSPSWSSLSRPVGPA
jgi:hypothetical protein